MPEIINDKQVFSLLEVTKSIQKTIENRYNRPYWIKAEMNKLNYYSHSGHCYPDLVEKKDGKITTQIRANMWSSKYQNINANFIEILKEPLKDGIKILFSATIGFHPQYGISLNIIDIDPSFTLGDLEKEKQDTIKRLHEEVIFEANKKLKLSILPKRVAIISVETSKGYADFLEIFHAANKSWSYKFFYMLFPSLLQGDKAAHNIISQLKKIKKVSHHFDVVAIMRGGGGDIGLACYNNYDLAKEIALFPIPVITGIGHATNLTVAEMVSFRNEITPTKLAEYLIQKFHNFSGPIQKAQEKLIDKARRLIQDSKMSFDSEIKLFRSVVNNIVTYNKRNIAESVRSLSQNSKFRTKSEKKIITIQINFLKRNYQKMIIESKNHLTLNMASLIKNKESNFKNERLIVNNLEKKLEILSPKNILKRGYSITLFNGKSVKNMNQVNINDTVQTILDEGELQSKILKRKKNKNG